MLQLRPDGSSSFLLLAEPEPQATVALHEKEIVPFWSGSSVLKERQHVTINIGNLIRLLQYMKCDEIFAIRHRFAQKARYSIGLEVQRVSVGQSTQMAATVLTIGQILIGIFFVRLPVRSVHTAMTRLMMPHACKARTAVGSLKPTLMVRSVAREPMKHKIIPSATHSMVMIFLLSSEIGPKPLTTAIVGTMWAIPQTTSRRDPK